MVSISGISNSIKGWIVGKDPENFEPANKGDARKELALDLLPVIGPISAYYVARSYDPAREMQEQELAAGTIMASTGFGCSTHKPDDGTEFNDAGQIPVNPDGGTKPIRPDQDAAIAIRDAFLPIDAEEPPVEMLLPENQFIQITGDRMQNQPTTTLTVYLVGGSGLKNLPLALEVTANPQLIDPAIPCRPGVPDITKDLTGNYIVDFADDASLLPVTFASFTLKDRHNDNPAADAVGDVNALIGAACGTEAEGSPVKVSIPVAFNAAGDLDTELSFSVTVDASQFVYGHIYDYRLSFAIMKDNVPTGFYILKLRGQVDQDAQGVKFLKITPTIQKIDINEVQQ